MNWNAISSDEIDSGRIKTWGSMAIFSAATAGQTSVIDRMAHDEAVYHGGRNAAAEQKECDLNKSDPDERVWRQQMEA